LANIAESQNQPPISEQNKVISTSRALIVTGLNPDLSPAEKQLISLSLAPRYNSRHPKIKNLFVTDRTSIMRSDSATVCDVILIYKKKTREEERDDDLYEPYDPNKLRLGDNPVVTLSMSTVDKQTNYDEEHELIKLSYTPKANNDEIQAQLAGKTIETIGTITKPEYRLTISVSYATDDTIENIIDDYKYISGATNENKILGLPPGTLMAVGASVTGRPGERNTKTASLTLVYDERKHVTTVAYTDPATGQIPADVVEDEGIKDIPTLMADFKVLRGLV